MTDIPRKTLAGVKVVHLASLGPGPYAAMLLADLGCDVTIVDRVSGLTPSLPQAADPRRRGQRSLALDLKQPEAVAIFTQLVATADILIEGMRPGVAERMGIGPDVLMEQNRRLIYARVTGWGQSGPLAQRAGHDINYVALTGALLAMGDAGSPPPVPLNLLGDYAGGGAFTVIGILAALHQRQSSGLGQVVDGAIVDGVASLTATTMGMLAQGLWGERGSNVFDGSAPWYRTYRTADGGYVAVGAIEPQFFAELMQKLGLDAYAWRRTDRACWPALAQTLAGIFGAQDRAHWEALFENSDACVTPVLSFAEAASHPHNVSRSAYQSLAGVTQPATAPRLSAMAETLPTAPPDVGAHTPAILAALGIGDVEIDRLRADGIIR